MLQNSSEFNSVGGGFGGGFGGFPAFGAGFGGGLGIAPIGLVGINNLFDRDGRGHDHKGCGGDGVEHPFAILQAISNSKDTTVAEGRSLASAICESEKTNLQQFYAQAIQAANNTQAIKDQATAFAIVADKRFDDLASAGVSQTAAILAKLNQTEIDNLRDQLLEQRSFGRNRDLEISIQNSNTNVNAQFQAQAQLQLQRDLDDSRRRWDNREIEINNINTNTNVQAQLQAQAQNQVLRDFDHNRKLEALLSQQNKVAQDIINIGSGIVGASQTANPTNVNSKNLQ